MIDLIDFALISMTDGSKFEQLACEVLPLEGYPDVTPLGGVHDSGKDAVYERYYLNKLRFTTVFQVTLQRTVAAKLSDTISKLSRNKIEYDALVLVCREEIDTKVQDELKKSARKDHGIQLHIIDGKKISLRLSQKDNGLFTRHFGGLREQLDVLLKTGIDRTPEAEALRQRAMLASVSAFLLNRHAENVKDAVVDRIVLSVIAQEKKGLLPTELAAQSKELFGKQVLQADQARAAGDRLKSSGLVKLADGRLVLSPRGVESLGGSLAKIEKHFTALIEWMLEEVSNAIGGFESDKERGRCARNSREMLVDLFRLFGPNACGLVLQGKTHKSSALDLLQLRKTCRTGVRDGVGDTLLLALAGALRRPEFAVPLGRLAKTYVGVELLNLDPLGRQLQMRHLKSKVFVLDTDTLLKAIIAELPPSVPT